MIYSSTNKHRLIHLLQATPKKAKAAVAEDDEETTAALDKVTAAIKKLPAEPAKFSLMEAAAGGGYQQGGDSVPPPNHGSKVQWIGMSEPQLHSKHVLVLETVLT